MRRWPDSIATGDPFEMEFRLRKHDGTFHWFLCRTQPLRDDVSGAVLRWYGSLIDIDAQKFAVERSKRVAETLQDVFLPKALPQFPNLRLDAVYLPAEKDALVGGDWYDAFELPDGRLFFSIGDVAGHGLDASATVGRLRQAIFTLAWSHDDPGAVMHALDEILTFQDPGTMVTAIVGCLDPAHTSMHYAIAGHPPPLLAHSKHEPAEVLGCGGPPLGVGIGFEPTVVHVDIRPHSVIALYTDGMTEFLRDVEATEAKLRAAVSLLVGDTNVTRPAKAVADLVFEDMPARDDAALLLMQFSPVDADIVAGAPRPLQRVWRFHSSSAFTAQSSRREVMAYLRRMAPEHPDFFDVELIVGEIFANTVRHAPGLVEVRVDWPDAYAILTVRDTGPGFDRLDATLPGNDLSESGRGIFLVTTLAKDVSVTSRHGHGTELRVILPIKRAE
jgi:anti-sigma regulatory factor (Ser/Thr protein kinase)